MYEFIVLSLLMNFPELHGYLMTKIANDMIGPWVKMSSGTLYPLLAKLERAELIQHSDQQDGGSGGSSRDHGSRSFRITEHGRRRFHQLMMDTSSNPGDYQRLFRLKVAYLDLLQSSEQLYLLNHYINYCQASILHFRSEAEDYKHVIHEQPANTSAFHREMALGLMQHVADQWQSEVEWALRIRERVVEQIENEPAHER